MNEGLGSADAVVEPYLAADDLERQVVEATLRCVARWGLAKTTFDDIGREAGVSRATVYRVVPGGKDRLVELVIRHELGRVVHELGAEASEAETLEDLACFGVTAGMRLVQEHEALSYMVVHEPEEVLPHFAFERLDVLFALVSELAAPHLRRFLPPEAIRPAAELLVRVVLSYSFYPSEVVDPNQPETIRRLVQVHLLPAVTKEARGQS